MAKDLKAFLTRMKEDPAFAEEVNSKGKIIDEAEKVSDGRAVLVKVGKELGYDFTVDDIQRTFTDERELSDAELKKIAGGYSWDDLWTDVYKFTHFFFI